MAVSATQPKVPLGLLAPVLSNLASPRVTHTPLGLLLIRAPIRGAILGCMRLKFLSVNLSQDRNFPNIAKHELDFADPAKQNMAVIHREIGFQLTVPIGADQQFGRTQVAKSIRSQARNQRRLILSKEGLRRMALT